MFSLKRCESVNSAQFSQPQSSPSLSLSLAPGGVLDYFDGWMPTRFHKQFYRRLLSDLNWRQLPIRLFGRWIEQPRLVDFHADHGLSYRYSGLTLSGEGWPEPLAELCAAVSETAGVAFNSVLCNLYRDGRDYMGWHADDERELGPEPCIASLSLGAPRRFLLRPREGSRVSRQEIMLAPGSLLLMRGDLQHHWQHQLPKALRVREPRINLTFRRILDNPGQR